MRIHTGLLPFLYLTFFPQALCNPGNDAQAIADDTCGIIFLGTPHHGSPVSVAGAIATSLTGFLGSSNTLLLSLRNHQDKLADLERRFRTCMEQKENRRQKTRIVSFHETKPTYLLRWFSIGLVSTAVLYVDSRLTLYKIVTSDSAQGYAAEVIEIDTDHSGLNKCSRREDQLYKELRRVIEGLKPYVFRPVSVADPVNITEVLPNQP